MTRVPLTIVIALGLAACAQSAPPLDGPQPVAVAGASIAGAGKPPSEEPPPAPKEEAEAEPAPKTQTAAIAKAQAVAVPKAQTAPSPKISSKGCNDPRNFPGWLAEFKQEAAAQGIKPAVIQASLGSVSYDSSVVAKDRDQDHFAKPFSSFASSKVGPFQLIGGRSALSNNRALLARIEKQFGVPGPVLTAFWGLESLYGTYTGNSNVIRSIATLAFDCRRPELFRPQLVSALRIVEKGDLTPQQMRGAWAGEMGQTQFMASDYYENAIDYDGDGKRRLKDSSADALGSTANLLAKWGWQRGQPWIEEVRVPTTLDWKEADLAIRHPRSKWAADGVTKANGRPIKADGYPAALLLPMGRNGPAFLAYPNFDVYLRWNESLTYSLTAAYFATRLQGADSFRKGNGSVASFSYANIISLQKLLSARGYDVGDIDGKLGAKTRAAVKDMQIKLGLPADSYPTPDLLKKLQQA